MYEYTKDKNRSAQVMILSVVILGGILLSASAIAGLLMIYQIRASNNVIASAKALFAADSGLEIATWCFFKGCDDPTTEEVENVFNPPAVSFDDSLVSFEIETIPGIDDLTIISRGLSDAGRTVRILEATLQ